MWLKPILEMRNLYEADISWGKMNEDAAVYSK
jgi:hypothetical protein